jgi:ABC-type antimicrobial peptide transport system permease subunit
MLNQPSVIAILSGFFGLLALAWIQCAVGIAIGILATFAAAKLVANQLYGVSPTDAKTSAAAALVLVLCITIAGYLPARRATRTDPMAALRHE